MASLWNIIRQEIHATVEDFHQKGAVGALRDAALDTCDMATSTGDWIVKGVQGVISNERKPSTCMEGIPANGMQITVNLTDGSVVQATVLQVDGCSQPPSARVALASSGEELLVDIIDPHTEFEGSVVKCVAMPTMGSTVMVLTKLGKVMEGTVTGIDGVSSPPCVAVLVQGIHTPILVPVAFHAPLPNISPHAAPKSNDSLSLLGGIKMELTSTMQEFREKGAVGTMKDAALDVKDLVGGTALEVKGLVQTTSLNAYHGARSLASPVFIGDGSALTAPSQPDSGPQQRCGNDPTLLDGLKLEWQNTVDDFRQKGAVGVFKDATLDAVDMVGSTAQSAVTGAQSLAGSFLGNTPAQPQKLANETGPSTEELLRDVFLNEGTVQQSAVPGPAAVDEQPATCATLECKQAPAPAPSLDANSATEKKPASEETPESKKGRTPAPMPDAKLVVEEQPAPEAAPESKPQVSERVVPSASTGPPASPARATIPTSSSPDGEQSSKATTQAVPPSDKTQKKISLVEKRRQMFEKK